MIRRAFRCVALLGGLAAAFASCRDLSVCQGTLQCLATSGGSGGNSALGGAPAAGGQGGANDQVLPSGGAAGDGAAGAAGSGPACELPEASCDESWLNGCETDLSGNVRHCGACNAECLGVCARGACHVPVALSEQAISPLSAFGVSKDSVYFVWGDYGGPYHLSREDKLGGEPRIIADNLPGLSRMVVASDRLFLWGVAENLRTVSLEGAVVDEGFEVSGVALEPTALYAGSRGSLLRRPTGSSKWQTLSWPTPDTASELQPFDVDGKLAVLRATGEDLTAHYEVMLAEDPGSADGGLRTLSTGSGTLVRVRALDQTIYWLIRTSLGGTERYELHRHSTAPDTREELVASELHVTDFALDPYFIFLSRNLDTGHELELILVASIAEKFHLGSRYEITSPEIIGDKLWYFDENKLRLESVNLGYGEFL